MEEVDAQAGDQVNDQAVPEIEPIEKITEEQEKPLDTQDIIEKLKEDGTINQECD